MGRRLMRAFEDLPPAWQDRIRTKAAKAPPLSTRQRSRVQSLLRGVAAPEEPDEATGAGE